MYIQTNIKLIYHNCEGVCNSMSDESTVYNCGRINFPSSTGIGHVHKVTWKKTGYKNLPKFFVLIYQYTNYD